MSQHKTHETKQRILRCFSKYGSLHCVSENSYCHPFWQRLNVSIICTLCIDVPETDRLFVELGHLLEYHSKTAHLVANHPIVHPGPLHTYPGIFESATISFRTQKFPCLQVSIFKSNLPVRTYPCLLYTSDAADE